MAKRVENHPPKTFNVAVVGLSGSEREKGCMGVGKSCLCNRFIRPLADDYYTDHISVLSQTDFSGRVVNNDHWLYWGEVSKTLEDGSDVVFSVVEQTEFIDDSCFQPFKSGKTEPYYKRCASTRLCSAEKLMYICKNQLGIEKEYEQKYLNDGRFIVDAFVCVFDVSEVQGRTLDKSIEYTALILNNLIKTKKPVVLVTTKHDEANEYYVREAERLVNKKDFRGLIPLIETSAHDNVNVDLAFITCLQILDRTRRGVKIIPYYDALRLRKETLDFASEAYQSLIRNQITDYRAIWNAAYKKLSQSQDFLNYCNLFGQDSAHKTFKRHVKKLKDDYLNRQMQTYLRLMPIVLNEMFPNIDSIGENSDWNNVKMKIRSHHDFDQYFVINYDKPWYEHIDNTDNRLPFDLLDTPEAEQCFIDHKASLESEDRRKEMRAQFKQLLSKTGFITPGKSFAEVRILFLGRECYESLSEPDLVDIYTEYQHYITECAKQNYQELLFEHAELFYHVANLTSNSAITQEDIFKINDALKDDIRHKALERLERERTLIILRHLGFLHNPVRKNCPAFPNCMEILIEKFVVSQARNPVFRRKWRGSSRTSNEHLNIVVLGSSVLAQDLTSLIKSTYVSYEFDKTIYTMDFKIIDGDVNLPENSIQANNFTPKACFCIYSDHHSLEYVRDSLEKTLLSNLEQEEDSLPFHGLPLVLLFAADANMSEKDVNMLREEGQNRAKNLQCTFLDVSSMNSRSQIDEKALPAALNALLESIQSRMSLVQPSHQQSSICQQVTPELRILLCMFCYDPYDIEKVASAFQLNSVCIQSSSSSLILDLNVCDVSRYVEIIFTSYHGAGAYRDELLHGFILVYSTHRKASLATLRAFSNNIPNTPTQIVAVTDNESIDYSNSSEAYYSNTDILSQYLDEGSSLGEKIQAHFYAYSSRSEADQDDVLSEFFREAWTRKPTIEKAFEMDEFDYSHNRPGPVPPPIPSRQDSYNIRSDNFDFEPDSEGIYENLPPSEKPEESDDTPSSAIDILKRLHQTISDENSDYENVYNQENDDSSNALSQIHDESLSAASPPPSYTSHCSPRLLPNQRLVYHPDSGLPNSEPSASMFASRRRRSAGLPGDRPAYISHQYRFKKSNSLQTDNLYPIEKKASRLQSELQASEEITDDDEDTVSSELSGYGAYPPPPEPAPPDLPSNRLRKAPSLPVSGHITPQRSLEESWMYNQMYEDDAPPEWQDHESRRYIFEHHEAPSSLSSGLPKPKPGKLNLKHFDNITDAVGRMSLSSQHGRPHVRNHRHLLSGDTGNHTMEYGKGSELLQELHYPYVMPGDSGERKPPKIRSLARRSRDPVVERVSDSDSDWSSPERLARDPFCKINRKPGSHKKTRRKRGIPVAPPRIPSFESTTVSNSSTSQSNCSNNSHSRLLSSANASLDTLEQAKGMGNEMDKPEKERKDREKKKQEEEKIERRRLKEEERQRKQAEKKKKKELKAGSSLATTLEDFAQSESNAIPLFVEKCVRFVEEEGLNSEGIYRVPGNRAQVDLLLQKFDEDPSISIRDLEIPVNTVATALKEFFSKRLPQLMPDSSMNQLTDFISKAVDDHNEKIKAYRDIVASLPLANYHNIKYMFQHFVKIANNSRLNSMDSKNLAICWWPTLLRYEFNDMSLFENMRPHLEGFVRTLIEDYDLIFCDKEGRVVVV